MSTPTNDSESLRDAPLVGPATASLPEDPLEALTTARILQFAPSGWNVLSIVSLVLAVALSPLAAVFGYVAVGQIRRSAQRGEAIAWVAVALGWVWTVAYVVAGAVVALTWAQVA